MTKNAVVALAVLAAVWGLTATAAEAKAPKNQTTISKRVTQTIVLDDVYNPINGSTQIRK